MRHAFSRACPAPILLAALAILVPSRAAGECNVIPAATNDFRAGLGSTNRPFASPGDVVEVRVRTTVCDAESTGFVDLDGDGSRSDDHVVLVLFTPPGGGTRNAVVLAESCAGLNLAACDAQLGGGSASCVQVNGPSDPFGFVAPDQSRIQFRFPDTDARLDAADDDRTFAGPGKIVVSRRSAPLACQLASQRCADLGGDTLANGVVACADELYELDGTCRTGTAQLGAVFGHFTALPPPNRFERMVNAPGITEVHLTTDAVGNLLLPMDYTEILIRVGGRPVPLVARASTNLDAFDGGAFEKIDIPVAGFAASYSPEGIVLPPVFSPLSDPTSPTDAILFGSLDAARGVVRVARQACVGGSREGLACTSHPDCTGGGTCTGPILELRDRYHAGVGALNLNSTQYTATRDMPITLESVAQNQSTQDAFSFVVYEGFDGVDRNGDGDATDFVLTLRDRESGVLRPIGPGGAAGRAVVQARDGLFAFPAVETSGNLVAFLESEPNQANGDTNLNGDVVDSTLRIYELEATQATERTAATTTMEAALAFAGRAGAWLGDRFFFRTAEAREALQTTGRASAASGGGEPNGFSEVLSFGVPPRGPATSYDGRFVVFNSAATDLIAGDTNATRDCFVLDRDTDADGVFDEPGFTATERVSIATGGAQANGGSDECVISASGRYVAFVTIATNLDSGGTVSCYGSAPGACEDVVVRDRVAGTTTRVTVDSGGGEPNGRSLYPSISADGRFVAFQSEAFDLVPGDTVDWTDSFVRDRCESEGVAVAGCTPTTVPVSVDSSGQALATHSYYPAISADGRFVVFNPGGSSISLHDRDADGDGVFDEAGGISTETVSLSFGGAPRQGQLPAISGDGRYVAFESTATDIVPGDTNGAFDVFVRDRLLGLNERVSVASDGSQGLGVSGGPFLSRDGRSVAFYSVAPNLVAGDTNSCAPDFVTGTCRDAFVHDRLTGATHRVSVSSAGAEANEKSVAPSVSPDGRFMIFQSLASNLVPGDGPTQDVFVRGVDTGDAAADRSGDGVVDDTVLRVADASGVTAVLDELCPGGAAAAAGTRVAFLRPEAAGVAGAPAACVQASADLNLDGDPADQVVHVYDGASVHNLGCAGSAVALSATHLAALVPECEEAGAETDGCGAGGTDLSADGDAADRVLAVHALANPLPASCGAWGPTALAGSALDVSGGVVALLSDEADLGPSGSALNGDGDASDRVLRLVDASTGSLIPLVDDQMLSVVPQQAQDFVIGPTFVAFRTRESAQSNALPPACSLNGDADCDDDVMQVYLLATGERIDTGQAAVPCPLPECDPRKPYRVSQDTVRFLSFESDQGQDLNQDGDQLDFLVQVFNVQSRQAKVVAEVDVPPPPGPSDPAPVRGTGSDPLAAPSEQIASAQTSQVAVAVGRCVEDRQFTCTTSSACQAGEFCFAEPPAAIGSCVRDTGASCYPDRPAGQQGCLAGATCVRDFVVLAIADRDADQMPDAVDNCPGVANTDQADADQDGVGDACDLQTCGDGALQLDEECDDGNIVDSNGVSDFCDSNCRLPVCGNGIVTGSEDCDDGNALAGDGCSPGCAVEECSNGLDDDGDGESDFGADSGCFGLADLSERDPNIPCDDGMDNDGDFLTDYPADPGCGAPLWIENPACDDGLDNDGDGKRDWDGAGVGMPDPQCGYGYFASEASSSCGLGFELALALPLLAALRRRRHRGAA